MDTGNVTRFEVVTQDEGRVYVNYGVTVELSLQDDGRTLKVFVRDRLREYVRKADGEA